VAFDSGNSHIFSQMMITKIIIIIINTQVCRRTTTELRNAVTIIREGDNETNNMFNIMLLYI